MSETRDAILRERIAVAEADRDLALRNCSRYHVDEVIHDKALAEVQRLRQAIRDHRDECLSDDFGEPTVYHGVAVYTHTVKLWDVLDEIPDTPEDGE